MKLRSFGNTNLRLSEIVLDPSPLVEPAEAVRRAFDAGVSAFFMEGRGGDYSAAGALGRALQDQGLRERVYLVGATDFVRWDGNQSVTTALDLLLEATGTDYLDLLLLHVDDQLRDPAAVQELSRQLDLARRTGGAQNFAAMGSALDVAAALETGLFQGVAAEPRADSDAALKAAVRGGHGYLALCSTAVGQPVHPELLRRIVQRAGVTAAVVGVRTAEDLERALGASLST